MRIDFSRQQYLSDDEQRLVRLMRAARAVAGTLVVAGLFVIGANGPPADTSQALQDAPAVHDTDAPIVGA